MKIGEIIYGAGEITLNAGRQTRMVTVKNIGQIPIRVSSHYPFFEVNRALVFDRQLAFGYRLNIPAGHAILFLPGKEQTVELVEIAGNKEVWGFNHLTDGACDQAKIAAALARARAQGFDGGDRDA